MRMMLVGECPAPPGLCLLEYITAAGWLPRFACLRTHNIHESSWHGFDREVATNIAPLWPIAPRMERSKLRGSAPVCRPD